MITKIGGKTCYIYDCGSSDVLLIQQYVTDLLLPELCGTGDAQTEPKIFIGGYSLAGFFALWAVYQTDLFSGAE